MNPAPINLPRLLTPGQVAEILGVAEQTLAEWRCTKRRNLPYVKVGRFPRYRPVDVQNWIDANLTR